MATNTINPKQLKDKNGNKIYPVTYPEAVPYQNDKNPTVKNVKEELDKLESKSVPSGGTQGQVLGKKSNNDYDIGWVNQTGGGGGTIELPDNLAYLSGSTSTTPPTPINADLLNGNNSDYFAKQSDMNLLSNDRGYLNGKGINSGSMNDITLNGKYIAYSGFVSDLPSGRTNSWYFIDVSGNLSGDYVTQLAKSFYYDNYYIRQKTLENGWTSWRELINSNMICNQNLLDNPWFTINQRGQSSYSGDMIYTLDRWILISGSVNINANGVTVNGTPDFLQKYELGTFEVGKTYTLSAIVDNILRTWTFEWKEAQQFSGDVWGWQFNVLNNWYGFNFISINMPKKDEHTIKAIKMEPGTISTLHLDPKPNPQVELAKCQRYYFQNKWYSTSSSFITNDTIYSLTYKFPVPMRIAPTIIPLVEQPIYSIYTYDLSTNITNPTTAQIKPSQITVYNNEMCNFQFQHTLGVKDYNFGIKDNTYAFSAEL